MEFINEDYELFGRFLGTEIPGRDRRADLVTAEAEGSLTRYLNARLLDLYWPLLWEGMKPNVAQEMPIALALPECLPDDTRLRLERKALEALLKGGKERLGVLYPELLRREASIREGYYALLDRLFSRIRERRPEICEAFFSGRDFGRITGLQTRIYTRPHGRSTARIDTEAGPFYFKPLSCRAESFYGNLAARFFPEVSFGARIISGSDYAFMEAIKGLPLRSHEELRTYYRHLGQLTAVFFALRSTDFHPLNLIACGTRPVPIDLECLFTICQDEDERKTVAGTNIIFEPREQLLYSVLYRDTLRVHGLQDGRQVHLPQLDGVARSVFVVESDYIEGFTDGYRDIMNRQDSWIAFLQDAPDMPVRISLRPSKDYVTIQKALHQPRLLADLEARDAFLEQLWAPVPEDQRDMARIIEREPLLNDDFPDMYMKFGQGHLYNYNGDLLKRDWSDSPLSLAVDRLRQMSEAELSRCVEEIRDNISRAREIHSRPLL